MSIDTKGGNRTFAAGAKYRLTMLESRRSAARGIFIRSERQQRAHFTNILRRG
jgi:hypothetical protein